MKSHCHISLLIIVSWIANVNVKAAAEHSLVSETVSTLADRKAADFFDTYWYLAAASPNVIMNRKKNTYMHLKADGTVDEITDGKRSVTFEKWNLSADGKSIWLSFDAARAAATGTISEGESRPKELQIQGGGSTLKNSSYTYRLQRKGPKEKKS